MQACLSSNRGSAVSLNTCEVDTTRMNNFARPRARADKQAVKYQREDGPAGACSHSRSAIFGGGSSSGKWTVVMEKVTRVVVVHHPIKHRQHLRVKLFSHASKLDT